MDYTFDNTLPHTPQNSTPQSSTPPHTPQNSQKKKIGYNIGSAFQLKAFGKIEDDFFCLKSEKSDVLLIFPKSIESTRRRDEKRDASIQNLTMHFPKVNKNSNLEAYILTGDPDTLCIKYYSEDEKWQKLTSFDGINWAISRSDEDDDSNIPIEEFKKLSFSGKKNKKKIVLDISVKLQKEILDLQVSCSASATISDLIDIIFQTIPNQEKSNFVLSSQEDSTPLQMNEKISDLKLQNNILFCTPRRTRTRSGSDLSSKRY